MKLKPHGYFLVNFVTSFVEGEMSRHEFDMDYSGYVIEHFPGFRKEHPRLASRFADIPSAGDTVRFREPYSTTLCVVIGRPHSRQAIAVIVFRPWSPVVRLSQRRMDT